MAKADLICEPETHYLDIATLPDLVLLQIFSNLDFYDLCKCARVCQRWYCLTKEFRKEIIILNGLKRPRELPGLIRYHCTPSLENFQLVSLHRTQLLRFSKADLLRLLKTCNRLQKLVLMFCYLNQFSLSLLPPTVRHVSVRGSHLVPEIFFSAAPEQPISIVVLDLSGVKKFLTSQEMHLVNKCQALKALFLEGCDRINNAGIEAIVDILPQLHVLDVEGTDISYLGANTIFNYCSNARDIYLAHTSIDDRAFENVYNTFPNLRTICGKGTSFTAQGLQQFMENHSMSHKENEHPRKYYESCLNYNETLYELQKSDLHPFTGCSHYETHPEYGRLSKLKIN